jgi:RNA polymerase sigma-70 factor (ECF subfamily)
MLVRRDGELDGVLACHVGDGRIVGIYYVRNPAKLTRVGSETALTRR